MGYHLWIGQFKGRAKILPGGKLKVDRRSNYGVEVIELDEAPCFDNDNMTGGSNTRSPGYLVWHEFTEIVGLKDLFYNNETGLIRPHPGIKILTPAHRDVIRQALEHYNAKNPGSKPGFAAYYSNDKVLDYEPDPILARLLWLDFWVNWAVENCELPVIRNS